MKNVFKKEMLNHCCFRAQCWSVLAGPGGGRTTPIPIRRKDKVCFQTDHCATRPHSAASHHSVTPGEEQFFAELIQNVNINPPSSIFPQDQIWLRVHKAILQQSIRYMPCGDYLFRSLCYCAICLDISVRAYVCLLSVFNPTSCCLYGLLKMSLIYFIESHSTFRSSNLSLIPLCFT